MSFEHIHIYNVNKYLSNGTINCFNRWVPNLHINKRKIIKFYFQNNEFRLNFPNFIHGSFLMERSKYMQMQSTPLQGTYQSHSNDVTTWFRKQQSMNGLENEERLSKQSLEILHGSFFILKFKVYVFMRSSRRRQAAVAALRT